MVALNSLSATFIFQYKLSLALTDKLLQLQAAYFLDCHPNFLNI